MSPHVSAPGLAMKCIKCERVSACGNAHAHMYYTHFSVRASVRAPRIRNALLAPIKN